MPTPKRKRQAAVKKSNVRETAYGTQNSNQRKQLNRMSGETKTGPKGLPLPGETKHSASARAFAQSNRNALKKMGKAVSHALKKAQ